ncbi:MAG: hypothetical protein ABI478_06810, partial [Propionivibrio sp.]
TAVPTPHGDDHIVWINPDGEEMSDEEWSQDHARCLGVFLSGDNMGERDDRGRWVKDDSFLLLFNSHHEPIPFRLPGLSESRAWLSVLDTHLDDGLQVDGCFSGGDSYSLEARSLALLMRKEKS